MRWRYAIPGISVIRVADGLGEHRADLAGELHATARELRRRHWQAIYRSLARPYQLASKPNSAVGSAAPFTS